MPVAFRRPEWKEVASVLKPGTSGKVSVEHFSVSKQEAAFSALRSLASGSPSSTVDEGSYTRLMVNGGVMMSDTDMEKRSNVGFICKAHGNVLIAGLGIGMIVHPILNYVDSVTIVERNKDVIKLVSESVAHPKVSIVECDIFEYKPPKGTTYNVIYFDIWPDICTDNLKAIAVLHQRFGRYLDKSDPDRWIGSWQEDLLKYRKRQEKASGW